MLQGYIRKQFRAMSLVLWQKGKTVEWGTCSGGGHSPINVPGS